MAGPTLPPTEPRCVLLKGPQLTFDPLSATPTNQHGFAVLQRYLVPPPLMVVLSGPAGVGKDSVLRALRQRGLPYHFVVTMTDRPRREGEVDGVDYVFVTADEFRRMIESDALLEYATVYNQHKGVPKEQVRRALASGLDVILRLDVQGAATMRCKYPGVVGIFLAPSSRDELLHRLRARGGDSEEQLRQRLEAAAAEIECACEFDYVVINREGALEATVDTVAAILTAERCRTSRRPLVL